MQALHPSNIPKPLDIFTRRNIIKVATTFALFATLTGIVLSILSILHTHLLALKYSLGMTAIGFLGTVMGRYNLSKKNLPINPFISSYPPLDRLKSQREAVFPCPFEIPKTSPLLESVKLHFKTPFPTFDNRKMYSKKRQYELQMQSLKSRIQFCLKSLCKGDVQWTQDNKRIELKGRLTHPRELLIMISFFSEKIETCNKSLLDFPNLKINVSEYMKPYYNFYEQYAQDFYKQFENRLKNDTYELFQNLNPGDLPLEVKHLKSIKAYMDNQKKQFSQVYGVDIEIFDNFCQFKESWDCINKLSQPNQSINSKISLLEKFSQTLPNNSLENWKTYPLIEKRMRETFMQIVQNNQENPPNYFLSYSLVFPEDRALSHKILIARNLIREKAGESWYFEVKVDMNTENDDQNAEDIQIQEFVATIRERTPCLLLLGYGLQQAHNQILNDLLDRIAQDWQDLIRSKVLAAL